MQDSFLVMYMYSCEDLFNLKQKPRINDISLKLLSKYYKKYLMPFKFRYTFAENIDDVVLVFKEENFCHLLGVESIVRKSVSQKLLCNYRGIAGVRNIESNNITFSDLKKINKKRFSNVKAKFVYFYLLPKLINQPLAVKYEKVNVHPPTKIECEILFYSKVNDDNAIIHLGIEKEEGNCYFPRTFFVEKVSNLKDDIYISHQSILTIKNTTVLS